MQKIGKFLGGLLLALIVAPILVVLYGLLMMVGAVLKVVLWPAKAVLGFFFAVLGGGVRSK